jgi:hypothetical protein
VPITGDVVLNLVLSLLATLFVPPLRKAAAAQSAVAVQ